MGGETTRGFITSRGKSSVLWGGMVHITKLMWGILKVSDTRGPIPMVHLYSKLRTACCRLNSVYSGVSKI